MIFYSFSFSEKCGEKSLIPLKEAIESNGFVYSCEDDPDALLFLMCNDYRTAKDCQNVQMKLRDVWKEKLSDANCRSISLILLIISLIFLLMSNE